MLESVRIGITGYRGFMGLSLTRFLQEKASAPIRVLVRTPAWGDTSGLDMQQGDLLSLGDCEKFVAGLDVIYYLAHNNSPVSSDRDLPNDALMNLIPLLTLLQAARAGERKPHIVYYSSGGAIYGKASRRTPRQEHEPCFPESSYGIQKLVAEQYLRLASEQGAITATVLRIGNAYGTLLPTQRQQGLIGVTLSNVLAGRGARVFGSPHNTRDYIYLDDVCELASRAARPAAGGFSIYNAGFGKGYSVLEVLDSIEACWGKSFEREFVDIGAGTKGLTDWVVLDVGKAERELGWKPRVDLAEGIARMLRQRG